MTIPLQELTPDKFLGALFNLASVRHLKFRIGGCMTIKTGNLWRVSFAILGLQYPVADLLSSDVSL